MGLSGSNPGFHMRKYLQVSRMQMPWSSAMPCIPVRIPSHQQRNSYGRPIVFRGRGLSVFRSQASSPVSLHDLYLAAAAWQRVPHVPCSQKRDSTKCNMLGGVLNCTWNHPRGTQLKASSLPYPFSGQSLGRQGCHHSGRQAAV